MKYQEIIKDSSVYTGSAVIVSILSLLQAIIVARMLGPALYGTLQIYRLILTYVAYSTLGTFWAMVREISFYNGKNDYNKVSKIKDTTFSINIISAVLVSILIIIVFFFLQRIHSVSMIEIFIVALIIITARVYGFLGRYLLAEKKFTRRSILIILFSICNIILIVTIGYRYKVTGILAAMLLAYIISIIYGIRKESFKVHFSLKKEEVMNLIKTGLPILGNGLLATFMMSIDKLMIIMFLSRVQLGYYSIAARIIVFMEMLYASVFMTIFPRLTERYGKASNIDDVKNYVLKPIAVSAHLSPLFFGSVIVCIPLIIKYILPQYMLGVTAVQFVIAASFFGCLQAGIVNFFIALNKIHKIYPFRIAAVILGGIMMYAAIRANWGIQGIALCVVITYAFFAASLIYYFLKQYPMRLLSRLTFLFYVYYPFIYMCGALWIIRFISFSHFNSSMDEILNIALKLLVFLGLNIPLLIHINTKTGVLGEIKRFVIHLFQARIRKNIPIFSLGSRT